MTLGIANHELPLKEQLAIRTTDRAEALATATAFFHGMTASFKEPKGEFRFQLNSGQLGQTTLTAQEQYISGGASFLVENDCDTLTIEIPLIGSSRAGLGSKTVDVCADKTFAITSPDQRVLWEDNGKPYRCLNFHFRRSQIERRWAILTGKDTDDAIVFDMTMDACSPVGAHFLQAALIPFRAQDAGPGILHHPNSAALFEDFLINTLLTSAQHSRSSDLDTLAPATSKATVEMCEEYFWEHADEAVTVSDAAEALGVSVRSLQRTFREERSTSPMRVLKDIRLDRVRARLLGARSKTNVTAIALSSGFSHLGSFSQDYRKRFGESPSETFRRRL